jgi:CheY-like chemotaxis protein
VYSEVAKGTAFKICLPLVLREQEQPAPEATTRQISLGMETVVVTEDDPGVRELVCNSLRGAGYTVLEACEAAEAVEIARIHRGAIDVLISDVVLPGMSGRRLVERIVRLRPRTRVIYMSGYTDDAVVNHGILKAGVPFLQKPFSGEALKAKLREVLDQPLPAPSRKKRQPKRDR